MLTCLAFFQTTVMLASPTDSLLAVLDTVIEHSAQREAILQRRVDELKSAFRTSHAIPRQFTLSRKIYYNYHRLQLDSALHYARLGVQLGQLLDNPDSLVKAQLIEAEAFKCLGRHYEALQVLNGIRHDVRHPVSPSYYYQYHSNLLSLYEMASDNEDRQYYQKLMKLYRDSTDIRGGNDDISLRINQGEILKTKRQYQEAVMLLEQIRNEHPDELQHNAIFWFSLADAYEHLGKIEEAKYGYAMAAIIDKRRCSKTYTALQNLSMLLYLEGDLDRAYYYITTSLHDVIRSGARQRLSLVTGYLSIINGAHEQQQQEVVEKRNIIIAVVSLSAIMMAILLLLLYRSNKYLAAIRVQLTDSNVKLRELNDKLERANKALLESNKIKEVYIAQLFNLCSENIDQLEHLRMSVLNKLKTGQHKELALQLEHSRTQESLKSFFHRFDAVFLQLFPDFIEKFNSLLCPGEELKVKEGALLSPELRIYALVRLGITDSTKIACFLHFSPQTVYNYRQKIRNKAHNKQENFMLQVQSL